MTGRPIQINHLNNLGRKNLMEEINKGDKKRDLLQILKLIIFLQDLRIDIRKDIDIDSIVELFLLCDKNSSIFSFLLQYMSSTSKHSRSDSIAHRRTQSGKISAIPPKIEITQEKMAATPNTVSSAQPTADRMLPYQRLVTPMPIPGAPGALFFDRKDVTAFADRYEAMCTLHLVTGRDILAVLRNYCAGTY
ncbi:hypothetical protein ACJ73_08059 [Blastomyces percursus]|uniref:Uncharacterized protein n=1 Tax=Blastomyces percursus TaxID=1658174 RepID=A0A1J9QWP4_9EURO|nr:hypothetical protein ACJ73_08059 [Blastomyces percursus]